MNKKTALFILVVIIVIVVLVFGQRKTNVAEVPPAETVEETVQLCFAKKTPTTSGLFDEYRLSMDITGDDVEGDFQYLPAEKDSKTGSFVGTVGALDQMSMSREATLWWSTMAEGMLAQEELVVRFGDGNSAVGFGEMTDRGDGVYVYKNKAILSWLEIPQVVCAQE